MRVADGRRARAARKLVVDMLWKKHPTFVWHTHYPPPIRLNGDDLTIRYDTTPDAPLRAGDGHHEHLAADPAWARPGVCGDVCICIYGCMYMYVLIMYVYEGDREMLHNIIPPPPKTQIHETDIGIKLTQVAMDRHYTIDPRFYGVYTVLACGCVCVFRGGGVWG